MALLLQPMHGEEIDRQIWEIYGQRLGGGELGQLAKLFKGKGLPGRLSNVLRPTLRASQYYREELEIKLAWIDKRPLVKLPGHSKRGELGDAAFFYFDIFINNNTIVRRQARALFLQAKVAKEALQMTGPSVPVNPSKPSPTSSTARELDLLSRWGLFDLYAASRSRKAILRGITIIPLSFPPANGWFMATPGKHPDNIQKRTWKSPWMCGPAKDGAPCAVTLGELLLAFFTSTSVTAAGAALPEVGVDFDFEPAHMTSPHGLGWDRLCVEILRLCPYSQLPRSLFGKSGKRGAAITSVVRSFPYFGGGSGPINLLLQIYEWLFPQKMPVLLVVMTRREGQIY